MTAGAGGQQNFTVISSKQCVLNWRQLEQLQMCRVAITGFSSGPVLLVGDKEPVHAWVPPLQGDKQSQAWV